MLPGPSLDDDTACMMRINCAQPNNSHSFFGSMALTFRLGMLYYVGYCVTNSGLRLIPIDTAHQFGWLFEKTYQFWILRIPPVPLSAVVFPPVKRESTSASTLAP